MKIIRIDTLIGTATIHGQSTHTAKSVARAWLKHQGNMGGGQVARVSIGVPGGCWHRVGVVGNR